MSGFDDLVNFEKIKRGDAPVFKDRVHLKKEEGHKYFEGRSIIGQTKTANLASLDSSVVKTIYEDSKVFFTSEYSQNNHIEFKGRQFDSIPESE